MINEPIVKVFTGKKLFLYHACIIVIHRDTHMYSDDAVSINMKPNTIAFVHGFTMKRIIRKVNKYLRKIEGE